MFLSQGAMKGERMRAAPHTRLAPGREAAYGKVHAVIPRDTGVALRDDPAGTPEPVRELS
jgi:hypothetical protein